jgi:hypothetical protein
MLAATSSDASDECILACRGIVRRITEGQRLGVDLGDEILSEYIATLGRGRSGGVGAKLAQQIWRQRYDARICHRVEITRSDEPPGSYAEVPEPLRDFDTDDQKFLAVAAVEGGVPPIFQALDREWWDRRTDFAGCGLDVQFLCITDLL